MRYGSVCSGIEAATVAFTPLGWSAAFYAEIDPFCCVLLRHHYPSVPNLGDFTTVTAKDVHGSIDLLIAGTPCQSFSVAGQRAGLADPRGNLTLEYFALVDRLRPRWVVWENVPGLLSDDGGRTFGTCLGILAECGYGFAYRVLDAQYFGVPQRRRRVFVVGYRGDWRPPAAVLFERESLQGHPAPGRETGESLAACLIQGVDSHGRGGYAGRHREDDVNLVAFPGMAQAGQGWAPPSCPVDVNRIGPLDTKRAQCIAFDTTQITSPANRSQPSPGDPCHPLTAEGHAPALAYSTTGQGWWREGISAVPHRADKDGENGLIIPLQEVGGRQTKNQNGIGMGVGGDVMYTLLAGQQHGLALEGPTATLRSGGDGGYPSSRGEHLISTPMHVRRLTPRECERLQGFPDDYTLVPYRGKPVADGPRYRALGNSFAVPVVRWISQRIQMVDTIRISQEVL